MGHEICIYYCKVMFAILCNVIVCVQLAIAVCMMLHCLAALAIYCVLNSIKYVAITVALCDSNICFMHSKSIAKDLPLSLVKLYKYYTQ